LINVLSLTPLASLSNAFLKIGSKAFACATCEEASEACISSVDDLDIDGAFLRVFPLVILPNMRSPETCIVKSDFLLGLCSFVRPEASSGFVSEETETT
jgi:hypothetical protein